MLFQELQFSISADFTHQLITKKINKLKGEIQELRIKMDELNKHPLLNPDEINIIKTRHIQWIKEAEETIEFLDVLNSNLPAGSNNYSIKELFFLYSIKELNFRDLE
jgi:hypothetical protein